MMKCTKCKKKKEYKYFSFRNDTKKYRAQCRQCVKGYKGLRSDKQSEIEELLKKGLKRCGKCDSIKSLDSFHSDKHTVSGLASSCIECKKEYATKNKDAIKKSRAKLIYNISDAEYDKLVGINNCQICNKEVEGLRRHIDHCHTTGVVRGILCRKCNLGLGHFRDNEELLRMAIKYLKANSND